MISSSIASVPAGGDVQTTVQEATDAGEVEVGAAAGVSACLDAGTSHGRIHNALNNTEGAAAQLTIHATTAVGDITARSLSSAQ